jgi:hypothetical protein
MSWNQGNGNGYGPQADVYGRLDNTRPVGGARFPFVEGSGRYALCTLEEFMHNTDGVCARALLEVIESKDGKHPVGSHVVKIWKLQKPAKFPNQPDDADLFADFCCKLKNAPAGYPIGQAIRVLMKERSAEQLARGTVIDAVAVPNQKGTWTNVYWNAVQQAAPDIAAMRQRLEAKGIPDTGSRAPQQPQGAPQAYGQPQMPAMPPQGYGAPPQAPMSQGYAPPAAPAPQGPPPGGYLGNVPPQNGGNNGGQGNGGW